MKRLFTSFIILVNVIFPLRFALADLQLVHSANQGRRVELVKRLKQAGRISELHAQKNAARITGLDKKIRRPKYTPGSEFRIARQPRAFFALVCGKVRTIEETPDFHLSAALHLLRAPPALA